MALRNQRASIQSDDFWIPSKLFRPLLPLCRRVDLASCCLTGAPFYLCRPTVLYANGHQSVTPSAMADYCRARMRLGIAWRDRAGSKSKADALPPRRSLHREKTGLSNQDCHWDHLRRILCACVPGNHTGNKSTPCWPSVALDEAVWCHSNVSRRDCP